MNNISRPPFVNDFTKFCDFLKNAFPYFQGWLQLKYKTSQELRMLSSVTLKCQATKIVMNSGFQLSKLLLVSQMSQVSWVVFVTVSVIVFVFVIVFVKCLKGHKSPGSLCS